MKAVIMAGGLGTRLRPLTCQVPKPMVPVMNRPILEHTILLLKTYNFRNIIILLYYLPDVIKDYFGDGSGLGVKLDYIIAKDDFGTAGAVKQAASRLQERFLVLSGDAITDIDLDELTGFHINKKAISTIALTKVDNPSPYGISIADSDDRITRFLEKPSWSQVFSDTVNMGIYMLEPEIFDYIPEEKEYYFAKDVFPALLMENKPVFGYTSDCYWKDIGDLKTYSQVHWDAMNNLITLENQAELRDGNIFLGENCEIDENVKLQNVVFGDNCKVRSGAEMANVILGANVEVGENCQLRNDVIADNCKVGKNTIINDDVYISNDVNIGADSFINTNIKIWPQKSIDFASIVNSSIVWGDTWQREVFVNSRVTGLTNYELTPEFAAKLGASFGAWVGKGKHVLLGRDATHASRMIYRAIITGLMSAGVNISTLQVLPIPLIRYALLSSVRTGGVYIRLSPYDRKMTDILFFDGAGRDLPTSISKAVERVFFREDFPRVDSEEVGEIKYPGRVTEFYITDFLKNTRLDVIKNANYRIVIDYSYGSATEIFPSIIGDLECEIISLNAHLDHNKLSKSKEEFDNALQQLSGIVRSTNSNMGFLIDPGAEKIIAVDETGEIIPSERFAVLITQLFLKSNQPRKVAAPVCVPSQIEELSLEHGFELVYTPDADSAIIKATEDTDVDFAVGIRGGFIFTAFHFAFDGMYALVKTLELLTINSVSLHELNQSIPRKFFKTAIVPCPWESKGTVMRKMTELSEGKPRVLVDGVKLIFEDGWVLVLPDHDRAVCHVMVEAAEEHRCHSLIAEYENHVKEFIDS